MFDAILSAPVFLIAFVLVISTVVVFHELGHYWVARWCGVAVDSFSVGFGPQLAGWRDRNGTVWRISALPLGGYVKFAGDADAASAPDFDALQAMKRRMTAEQGEAAVRSVFHFQPVWRRALIVAAGPVANFILAILIFTFLYSIFGTVTQPAVVGEVSPDSAAEAAGFEAGDRIVRVDGRDIRSFNDLQTLVLLSAGEDLSVTVERGDETLVLTATPDRIEMEDPIGGKMQGGRLGIQSNGETIVERHNPIEAVGMGVDQTWEVVSTTGRYLGRIAQGKESADMLGGPIRIATTSGKLALDSFAGEASFWDELRAAAVRLISLAGVLSVALGMINLVPIPVLDGGHLLYYGFEAARGRPLSERAQAFGFRAGIVLVAGLMLFATWNDLNYLRGFFS